MTALSGVRRRIEQHLPDRLVRRDAGEAGSVADSDAGGDGAKRRTLVVLSTPRSGTHLLAHELAATGRVGLAEEFFHDQLMAGFGDRFGVDTDDLSAYVEAWHTATASDAGIAAVVVFPDHVQKLAAAGALGDRSPSGFLELLDLLPDPVVVLLERQSVLDQAISFNRSTQSWVWTRTAGQEAPPHPPYDFESLSAHVLRLLHIRQWSLDAAAELGDRLVLRVSYEQLVADPAAVVQDVLEAMGLRPPRRRPASLRRSKERPERAADEESRRRRERLDGDLAQLTSRLRWAPGDETSDSVRDEIATIVDRQLRSMADAVEAHRASAFRRRPIVGEDPPIGTAVRIATAVAASRRPASPTMTVLTHGLDQWVLDGFYGTAATADVAVGFTRQWADLAEADVVHVNSVSLGWGHVDFDTKSAMIDRARAALRELAVRNVPILWTITEPITPGTSHVALESQLRAELADRAAVIHVPNRTVLDRAKELFAVPEDRLVVGEFPVDPVGATPGFLGAAGAGAVLSVPGSLTSLPGLGSLARVMPMLDERLGAPSTLVVAGSTESIGVVAHRLRELAGLRAGTVVAEGALDASAAASLAAASDVVLVPCSPHATYVPASRLASVCGTPTAMTSCPAADAVESAVGVDWADAWAAADSIVALLEQDRQPGASDPDGSPTVTIADLMGRLP